MKKTVLPLLLALIANTFAAQAQDAASYDELRNSFRTPPSSVQTSVYWYWMADHVTEEGVVKDLHAMKQAGINRAFIGNIGYKEMRYPGGKVKFLSEQWWKITHTALKTATELGIEIGIFNGPGWSQSGGPWVKPEQSMKYLASSTVEIKGGRKVDIPLPKPDGYFADVKVLAFPKPKADRLSYENCRISANGSTENLEALTDDDLTTELNINADSEHKVVLDFAAEREFTLRSVKIHPTFRHVNTLVRVEVKEGDNYRCLGETRIDRFFTENIVGFDEFAPIVMAVDETKGKDFRVVISECDRFSGLREISLSSASIIERYPEKTFAKMFQQPLPNWNSYIWRDQPEASDAGVIVPIEKVIDVTSCREGDRLCWEVPEGEWIVMRTGMATTGVKNSASSPEGLGLETDKMSKEHLVAHWNNYMGEMIKRIPETDRKCWKVIVQDSYETGGQNFTDDFIETFKAKYGYDPVPFFPVYQGIVVGNEEISNRFLWDVRRFVADRVAYDYVGTMRELGHQNGFTTWLENYGHWGFPGEFLQYGGQSDEVAGEYWAEGGLGEVENRAASSCAHIYGKKKVSSESFTSSHAPYARHPGGIKVRGDRFFSEGVNNSLLHLYIHQAYEQQPGLNTIFATEFNRHNVWFSHMDLFTLYLKRCNYMLQQGINVADVAYFIGEDAPSMTGAMHPGLPKGYQFDFMNAEVILTRMSIKDGYWTLPDGVRYKIMVLAPIKTMRPELLAKIEDFVLQGGVILGPAPERSPSLENYPVADSRVKELAGRMWAGLDEDTKYKKYGKGMIIDGMNLTEAFELLTLPQDCNVADAPVLYNHRQLGGTDIYFLTNQSGESHKFSAEFRTKGKAAELFLPTTGECRELYCSALTETGSVIPLELAPNESCFVVFRSGKKQKIRTAMTNYPEPSEVLAVNTPWTLEFEKERKGPESMVVDELFDLTKSEDFDTKYYSGRVNYTTRYTLEKKPEGRVYLNLGTVREMAKIKVNGSYVGGLWTPPYEIEVAEYLVKGENTIEIETVNTWVNRLVGDSYLPEDQRITWTFYNPYNPSHGVPSSGLLGPVTIKIFEK